MNAVRSFEIATQRLVGTLNFYYSTAGVHLYVYPSSCRFWDKHSLWANVYLT